MITTKEVEAGAVVGPSKALPLPVKIDTRGRLRVTPEQRRELLAAFAQSGEALPRFARRMGLKYSTIARWVQADRRIVKAKPRTKVRLVEAVVDPSQANVPVALVLQWPGGVRLPVATAEQARLAGIVLQTYVQPC